MATIEYSYRPHTAVLSGGVEDLGDELKQFGGFDSVKRIFTPLRLNGVAIGRAGFGQPEISGAAVFETVSAAVEAEILDDSLWPSQLFADRESFDNFVATLSDYEDCYKLVDPWWSALCALVGVVSGDGCEGHNTAADLAERLEEALYDLPDQWT
mgnify:CR=1 FL=1